MNGKNRTDVPQEKSLQERDLYYMNCVRASRVIETHGVIASTAYWNAYREGLTQWKNRKRRGKFSLLALAVRARIAPYLPLGIWKTGGYMAGLQGQDIAHAIKTYRKYMHAMTGGQYSI